jgi:HlyD family secretion protein
MKRIFAAGWLVLVLLTSGCGASKEPEATPEVRGDYVPVVSVTGEIVPERWATLSAEAGGTVVEVLAEPGDRVSKGAPVVLLDTIDLEIALRVAREEVSAQQALLGQLREGASEEVIARADRENAHQVVQAEIALKAAQQQLARAQAQDPADDIAVAGARVKQIEKQLVQVRAQDPKPEVEAAQVEVERAKIALDDTQNEYNKALDRPWEDQEIRDAWTKQLEQAQLNYRAAQAQLDRANGARRAHGLSLDVLAAQLEEAQAVLAQAAEAREAHLITLEILDSAVRAAQAQLDHLLAWENPYRDDVSEYEIAQAEARLEQAELSVEEIEQRLREATVVAPFDGTVGGVYVRVGEIVSPGQSLVILGDLGTLRVETTDLDEIDVARVALDQRVLVTFDALPERVFAGRVTRISPMAESGTGGVHYTVVIELEESNPALRWGMTAFVDIEVE